jgi:hypothetical protein
MSTENTETAAESTLLAAVMAPDTQDIEQAPSQQVRDADPDAEPEEEVEEQPEPQAKAKADDAAEPEEDEIEIPGEEGAEPKRLKLSEVVQKAQEYERFEAQKAQIVEQVQREAVERVIPQLRQVEQFGQQTGYMIQAALQLLQAPQPPNADAMLNPASPQYDPDGYHRAFANYQRMAQMHNQTQELGDKLLKQAQAAQAQITEQRELQELQRLNRVWPEFSQRETIDKFVSDMTKSYGFTPEELDAVLTDHRQALVARDALAYRAMKAQSGDVKAKVEAKAPKLVRSKQEAKGSPAAQRDGKGQFVSNALGKLKQTNSDDDAAAYFAGLVKAGRI